ncbi:signal peptidase I [Arthrobacter sp. STN4]|uniref:signal peptidase I n=1 Tax=Arthrobacter sp. STN4 TaxID=2923276 RepID=UPI00211A04C6|nr:signal peptidase I [Arthrobacter sp. STN4]MCQ9163342.1 signal peptidase I [Arthrobacter sp. STN4]
MTATHTATPVAQPATPASTGTPVRRWLRLAGRAVAYLLFLVAALAALVLVVAPLATGSQTYTVLTNSMAPKYAPGTFMVVKPTPFADLRVGDIITYQIASGKPAVISHRIISVGTTQSGERVFTTKGDNNSLADAGPVHAQQVRGKLLYAVPYVGFVANSLGQTNRGAVLPIAAVGLIGFGAFSMVQGAWGKKRTKKESGQGA